MAIFEQITLLALMMDSLPPDVAPPPLLNLDNAGPDGICQELRRLLALPEKQRQPEWEAQAARYVALLEVDFLKRPADELALMEITLVHFAAQKGCKAARKSTLNPARWADQPPRALFELFESSEERKAAIKALSSLKSPWVIPYVIHELSATNGSESVREALLLWCFRAADSSSIIIRALIDHVQGMGTPRPLFWIVDTLKSANKLNGFSLLSPGLSMAGDCFDLLTLLVNDYKSTKQDAKSGNKVAETIQEAGCAIIEATTALDASQLFQPSLMATLQLIAPLSKNWPKISAHSLPHFSLRTLNEFRFLLTLDNTALIPEMKRVTTHLAKSLPHFGKDFKREIAANSILSVLLEEDDCKETSPAPPANTIEETLAALVPIWDLYALKHLDDPELSQLSALIEQLLQKSSVQRFGVPSAVEEYQPFRHHLAMPSTTPPRQVKVSQAGLLLRRPDGSERILLKALVTSQ